MIPHVFVSRADDLRVPVRALRRFLRWHPKLKSKLRVEHWISLRLLEFASSCKSADSYRSPWAKRQIQAAINRLANWITVQRLLLTFARHTRKRGRGDETDRLYDIIEEKGHVPGNYSLGTMGLRHQVYKTILRCKSCNLAFEPTGLQEEQHCTSCGATLKSNDRKEGFGGALSVYIIMKHGGLLGSLAARLASAMWYT